MERTSNCSAKSIWLRAAFAVIATAVLMGMVTTIAPAAETTGRQVQSISIKKSWSWSGHRPRQAGERIAMGKEALEKEAHRKIDEWNSAPGPVHYKLLAVEFEKNSPCKWDYDRNQLTGVRTSWAKGTARGVMVVQFDIK